jgi:hypothetical protein
VVGGVLVLTGTASGWVDGVGSGRPSALNGPDLVEVRVLNNDLRDGVPELVRFCFDKNLNTVGGGAAFQISTYDAGRRMVAAAAARATDSDTCATASFPSGTDVREGTVGIVLDGAVRDTAGNGSIRASAPLRDAGVTPRAGATTGPDLIDVSVDVSDSANKRVSYIFDEDIDPAQSARGTDNDPTTVDPDGSQILAANFGAELQNGQPAATGTIAGRGDRNVIVNFGAQAINASSRFLNEPGAVRDRPQQVGGATPASPGVVEKGAQAGVPRLIAAAPAGNRQWLLTYSSDVNVGGFVASRIRAVADDGVSDAATDVGPTGSTRQVLARFANFTIARDSEAIVRIFSGFAATTSLDGSVQARGSQAATATPNNTPGFTNGPDLVSVAIDTATNQVNFVYDEPLYDVATPSAANFVGWATDGSFDTGIGQTIVDGRRLNVRFPSTLPNFVAFGQADGAAADLASRGGPQTSVSKDVNVAPAAPAPPAAAPPAAPPVIAPAKGRFPTRVSVRRRGSRLTGRLISSGRGCVANRRIVLKALRGRRKVTVARFLTKGNGTFKLALPRKARRLSVYLVVPGRTGSAAVCGAASSTKLAARRR